MIFACFYPDVEFRNHANVGKLYHWDHWIHFKIKCSQEWTSSQISNSGIGMTCQSTNLKNEKSRNIILIGICLVYIILYIKKSGRSWNICSKEEFLALAHPRVASPDGFRDRLAPDFGTTRIQWMDLDGSFREKRGFLYQHLEVAGGSCSFCLAKSGTDHIKRIICAKRFPSTHAGYSSTRTTRPKSITWQHLPWFSLYM